MIFCGIPGVPGYLHISSLPNKIYPPPTVPMGTHRFKDTQKLCEHIIECLSLDSVLHDGQLLRDFNVALWTLKRQWLDVWNVIFSRQANVHTSEPHERVTNESKDGIGSLGTEGCVAAEYFDSVYGLELILSRSQAPFLCGRLCILLHRG